MQETEPVFVFDESKGALHNGRNRGKWTGRSQRNENRTTDVIMKPEIKKGDEVSAMWKESGW